MITNTASVVERSNGNRKYRYPGMSPFTSGKVQLFFGRDKEVRDLYHLVKQNRLTILAGRSGLGKSSLLSAGLFDLLAAEGYIILTVRFNQACSSKEELLEHFVKSFKQSAKIMPEIEIEEGDQSSVWEYLQTVQFWHEDNLLCPLICCDQFEEIFTLQDAATRSLIMKELSPVIRGIPPERSHGALPNSRVIFSIRSEYVGFLQQYGKYLPKVLDNVYLLRPLSVESAREAIIKPGLVINSDLSTPPFSFNENEVDRILNYLKKTSSDFSAGAYDYTIEPFQLQIICSHIEKQLYRLYLRLNNLEGVHKMEGMHVPLRFLGDRNGYEKCIANFYSDVVEGYPRKLQKNIQKLCERGLIRFDAGTGMFLRVPLAKQAIMKNYELDDELLNSLEESRLLRKIITEDTEFYELSHDRFVNAIINARPWSISKGTMIFGGIALSLILILGIHSFYLEAAKEKAIADTDAAKAETATTKVDAAQEVAAAKQEVVTTKGAAQKQVNEAEKRANTATTEAQASTDKTENIALLKRQIENLENKNHELRSKNLVLLAEKEAAENKAKAALTLAESKKNEAIAVAEELKKIYLSDLDEERYSEAAQSIRTAINAVIEQQSGEKFFGLESFRFVQDNIKEAVYWLIQVGADNQALELAEQALEFCEFELKKHKNSNFGNLAQLEFRIALCNALFEKNENATRLANELNKIKETLDSLKPEDFQKNIRLQVNLIEMVNLGVGVRDLSKESIEQYQNGNIDDLVNAFVSQHKMTLLDSLSKLSTKDQLDLIYAYETAGLIFSDYIHCLIYQKPNNKGTSGEYIQKVIEARRKSLANAKDSLDKIDSASEKNFTLRRHHFLGKRLNLALAKEVAREVFSTIKGKKIADCKHNELTFVFNSAKTRAALLPNHLKLDTLSVTKWTEEELCLIETYWWMCLTAETREKRFGLIQENSASTNTGEKPKLKSYYILQALKGLGNLERSNRITRRAGGWNNSIRGQLYKPAIKGRPELNIDMVFLSNVTSSKKKRKVSISSTEITFGQFNQYVEKSGASVEPSGTVIFEGHRWVYKPQELRSWMSYKKLYQMNDDYPVIGVSYRDAKAFCEWLTKEARKAESANKNIQFRLPTVDEWCEAARLGTNTNGNENSIYPWGDQESPPNGWFWFMQWIGGDALGPFNWAGNEIAIGKLGTDKKNVSSETAPQDKPSRDIRRWGYKDAFVLPAPSSKFSPDALGLYNMLGNVREWVVYRPPGVQTQEKAYTCGGSWFDADWKALRYKEDGPFRIGSGFIGFRIVKEVDE